MKISNNYHHSIRLVSLSLLLTIMFLLFTSTSIAADPPTRVKPVVIDQAKTRQLAPTAQYSGAVISKNDALIAAEIEGRLTWVADVGATVKQGDVIAKLDDVFLQQQRSEELAVIQSEQAKLDLHEKEVQRYQRLLKQNNVAENQLDQSISDRAVAQSNIAAARARLAQIDERINRSSLRAPFSGIVTERFAQAGEWSQNGTALLRLVDTNNLEVQVRVPQSIYSLIKIGNKLSVYNSQQIFQAKVNTIVPIGTTSSRLFEIRLLPETTLFPGTLVRVSIPTAQAKEVVSIHRDALVLRKGRISVFRINKENVAEQIRVSVGTGDGNYIEAIGNINAGDRIVIRGGERLQPGETVKISKTKTTYEQPD